MVSTHSPGTWRISPRGGAVVTDQPLPGYNVRGGHDAVDYYGGHLIAESIWRPEDARAISALPELMNAALAAEAIFARQGWAPDGIDPKAVALRMLRAAIAKATGGEV